MARPEKIGLDYFPFDVNLFEDDKVRAVSGEFGIKGEITLVKLLCAIYRNGYFILWHEPVKMRLLGNLPGISPELLERIVNRLVLWDTFDEGLFGTARVLTSKAIQRRYFAAISRRKISSKNWPYYLLGTDTDKVQKIVNAYNNPINVCNNPVSARKSTQRKDNHRLSLSFKENIEIIEKNAHVKKVPESGYKPPDGWKPVGEIVEELLSDNGWRRAVVMCAVGDTGRMLTEEEFDNYVKRYGYKLLADGETYKHPQQARYHFNNWLRIVLKEENREKHETTATNMRISSKREANAEVLRGLAESYRAEWQGDGVDGTLEKPY